MSNKIDKPQQFDDALRYLKRNKDILKISSIASRVKMPPSTLRAVVNGTKDKYNKPTPMPEKYKGAFVGMIMKFGFVPKGCSIIMQIND